MTDNAEDPKLVIEMFCDYVEDMFTLSETNPNLVVVATVHASKGTQARTAYIFQPDFLPLQERIELGGWEEEEERCLPYVADSRAEDNLIRLQQVDPVTRESIKLLFEPEPGFELPDISSSQESVDPDENKEESTSEATVGPSEIEIKKALAILELETLPGTTMELNSILRMRTMATHPDRMSAHNLSWEASNAHTAVLLEARNTLKKALEQKVLEPMNGASSQ